MKEVLLCVVFSLFAVPALAFDYNCPPRMGETEQRAKNIPAGWEFVSPHEAIWQGCEYSQTSLLLARPLPAGVKKCRVLRKEGAKLGRSPLKDWRDYTFQYQGREISGKRYVFVNALCKKMDKQELQKNFYEVLDGGSCYFNVKYDPQKDAFFELYINGEA